MVTNIDTLRSCAMRLLEIIAALSVMRVDEYSERETTGTTPGADSLIIPTISGLSCLSSYNN